MQISQDYIIRILQHFATKLWNITNFVMLFRAMMEYCLDLLRSKFWFIGEWSIGGGGGWGGGADIHIFVFCPIDLSPYNQNFDLGKSRQIFHHSLKEHHKISNIPKFRCEML